MSDQEIFDDNKNNTPPKTPESSDPFADKLNGIVNENGEPKYKTVDDALVALGHSQQFIETLKAEKAEEERKRLELESELNTRKSVEQVVQDLTNPTPTPTPNADLQDGKDQGLNEDKVMELVKEVLNQNQQTQTVQSNINTVVSTLSETYGDNARKIVADRAKELGTSPKALQELAGQNPQLVLSLFADVKPENTTPVKSSTLPPVGGPKQLEMPIVEKKIMTEGASEKDLLDAWRKSQEYTYEKLGVETN